MIRLRNLGLLWVGFITILICIASCHPGAPTPNNTELALDQLDSLIEVRGDYIALKEQDLKALRDALSETITPMDQYALTLRLAEEYSSYRFDTAYLYSQKAVNLASALEAPQRQEAGINLAYCYLSSGLFFEAEEVIRTLACPTDRESQIDLCLLQMKKNLDLASYNSHTTALSEHYLSLGLAYADSALHLVPDHSKTSLYLLAHYFLAQGRSDRTRETLRTYLQRSDLDLHDRAIAHSLLGQAHLKDADINEAIKSFALSAGYDILSGTRETTSMRQLASLLYEQGEITRAAKYIDLALEDANFYDAKHRKMSVGDIRPLIEQSRLQEVELRRQQMVSYTIAVSTLCLLLLTAAVVIIIQMNRLRCSARMIEEQNDALSHANRKMAEANAIKDEYIGLSFNRQGSYLREQEELFAFILKKLECGQNDAIRKRLKHSQVLQERKAMYADFDETFNRLFPTFMTEYNALFAPEDREPIQPNGAMTPEMRIFALIRVGITKPEQIALFLNYSVNTINTYKTRTKNKSLLENKDFEHAIMRIGEKIGATQDPFLSI